MKEIDNTNRLTINIPHCLITKDGKTTLLFNKDIISTRLTDRMVRRPDIYLQKDLNNKAYIINVTIVIENNSTKAYAQNKYKALQEIIRDKRGIKKVKIIQVIITINGFIYKISIEELKDLELEIDFTKTIRTLAIKQMKDLMFYLLNENIIEE